MKTMLTAAAVAALLAAGQAHAAAPLWGFQISSSSEPLTATELASFLGAPDDLYTGLGAGFITYDFGPYRMVDGAGQDFNVYEVDSGAVEFASVDILVSADGINFCNVEASALAAVDLVGDEAHGNASFRRSYDLAAAVTGLGVSQFRYLRLDGTSSGAINGSNGFDPDAVGVINYIDTTPPPPNPGAVPEPATWTMMILGFGAAGAMVRRRRLGAA
jgi:hypothetical protein